jgi:hypothetical protein
MSGTEKLDSELDVTPGKESIVKQGNASGAKSGIPGIELAIANIRVTGDTSDPAPLSFSPSLSPSSSSASSSSISVTE